jgi:bifunctional UDP-N-acetylglucosamine pyrophosphorylase/glucosamine-1-phosphate N-acetyltransferase
MGSNLSVIILAAGKGSRMKTDLPKVLCRTVAGPMIDVVISHALKLSPNHLFIVTGYERELVENHVQKSFGNCKTPIHFVHQSEQLGTGHAVRVVADDVAFSSLPTSENLLILYGDTPLLEASLLSSFLSTHNEKRADLSLITVHEERQNTFGRIIRSKDSLVQKITEVKDCTPEELTITEVNSGIYLISQQLLQEMIYKIEPLNAQKEFYLTDLVELSANAKRNIAAYMAPSADHVMGVNNLIDLHLVNSIIMNEYIKKLITDGVSFVDPTSVFIEPSVTIGSGSVIGPNVQLSGSTRIGSQVTIEGTALIIDSSIADSCTIKLGSRIEGSMLEERVSVGPFANIRPDTVLKHDVKIGNFVETKKSVLEAGVKVNHLSYIGDATVGTETNIGAGTITCNYDGFKKSKTTIGERVFIGSNSSLVAPVTIAADTTIGAGSVITKDVAAGALAVTRAEQKEIPGWSAKKRAASKKH